MLFLYYIRNYIYKKWLEELLTWSMRVRKKWSKTHQFLLTDPLSGRTGAIWSSLLWSGSQVFSVWCCRFKVSGLVRSFQNPNISIRILAGISFLSFDRSKARVDEHLPIENENQHSSPTTCRSASHRINGEQKPWNKSLHRWLGSIRSSTSKLRSSVSYKSISISSGCKY